MRNNPGIFFSGMDRKMKLTGARKEEYDKTWLPLRRGRKIDAGAFRAVVARLEKAETKAILAAEKAENARRVRRAAEIEESRRALAEAVRMREEKRKAELERKKVFAEAKRTEKENKRLRALVVGEVAINADSDGDTVIGLLDRLPKRTQVRVLLYRGGVAVVDTVVHLDYMKRKKGGFTIEGDRESIGLYWKHFKPVLTKSGSPPVFLWHDWGEDTGRLLLAVPDAVASVRLRQAFADGVVHCAVSPLLAVWEKLVDGDVGIETRKKYARICAKLRDYALRYPGGVPEGEEMEELAAIAMHRICIVDIFGAEYLEYNSRAKRRFYYRNVRENHLEEGGTVVGGVCDIVSAAEFETIKAEHEERRLLGEFYMFEGIGCIRSGRGAWRVENPLHDLFDRFSKETGIISYGIDACRYPVVASFLRAGCLVNSVPVVFSTEWDNHIDIKNAYIQHSASSYFEGFLSHIWTWRSLSFIGGESAFLAKHLGIYKFTVVSCSGWVQRLGLTVGCEYTLPSPEIRYMLDHGVEVRLTAGCFGGRLDDIKYSAEMLAPVEDTKKPYANWAGCQGSYNPCRSYSFYGTLAWASHLRSLGYDVWFNDGLIRVEIPKKVVPVRYHILAFITSYCRINMLLALEKFSDVSAIVMDGIYFKGAVPSGVSDIFREKATGGWGTENAGWYSSCYSIEVDWAALESEELLSSCMLVGAGGSGKTESVLREKESFHNILYVVPVRALGEAKYAEHGVRWTTIHKLIGNECVPWRDENVEPAVVLLDELTMIEASWIREARKMYPQTMFLICGDIDETMAYQCRSGDGTKFSEVFLGDGLPFLRFTNDYRALDDMLKELKVAIRAEMRRIYTDGGGGDARKIRDWIRSRSVSFGTACSMFAAGDTWIAGTHRTNAELLKKGVVSGSCTTGKRSSELVTGWEVRGSFSTHSFQGSTIETGKVFVSIDDAFEIAMIYTALSRARRFSQLVFVSGGCGYGVQ